MAKKVMKKKIVDVETGEVEAEIEELVSARDMITARLGKALNRKAATEADIASMELSLELIGQKLDEAGYVEGE